MAISKRTFLERVQATARAAVNDWAVPRQLAGQDPLGKAAESSASRALRPRLQDADRVGTSICPYCAVGCAQLVYAQGNDETGFRIIHVEGDPRSPINQGTLCPKGAATSSWINNPNRLTKVKYRRPYADHWEEVPLEWAMERIAFLIKQTRDETFVRSLPGRPDGQPHRGNGIAGRRDPRQRRELPDQEILWRRAGHGLDRKPGPHMTQLLGARSGHLLRARGRHYRAVGPGQQLTAW